MSEKKFKCFGEFICSNCGKVTKKKFILNSPEQIKDLYVDCTCGKHVEQYIPSSLREAILCLAAKGYKIFMTNEKTIGIVFNGRLPEIPIESLPYEFTLNTTEEEGDILLNERCQYEDFEGVDEDEYRKQAIENLIDFCRTLPTIGDGEYVVIDEEEELE